MAALARRVAGVIGAWTPDERDAVLYAASALFAGVTAQMSGITLYRQWGEIAVGPYALAAAASALVARRARRRPGPPRPAPTRWYWTGPRATIFLLVLVGATLLPLSLEVLWRSDGGPATAHVQPETLVIEHSGQRVARGLDPYQRLNPHRLPPVARGEPTYDDFNPYLPLMSVFGLARDTHASPRLTDARVAFSLVTIVVVIAALGLTRGESGPRVLALQAMTVLPTAALPLATGGDDLPVAAAMLLGLVLLQRRRPWWAGMALGVAASMKITAWPLAALALLVARGRPPTSDRRARMLVVGGTLAVVVPAVLPSALSNVPAFVENVIRFPLGLAGVTSPAATPLIGHLIVEAFPGAHRLFTLAVAGAGVVALGWVLMRRRPQRPHQLAYLLGWAMTVAICLAPATRIGYLLYPVDFFVWAWLLHSEERADALLEPSEPGELAVVGAGGPTPGDDESGDGPPGRHALTARQRRRRAAA